MTTILADVLTPERSADGSYIQWLLGGGGLIFVAFCLYRLWKYLEVTRKEKDDKWEKLINSQIQKNESQIESLKSEMKKTLPWMKLESSEANAINNINGISKISTCVDSKIIQSITIPLITERHELLEKCKK